MPLDTKKSSAFRSGQYLEINNSNTAESLINGLTEKENKLLYEALTKKLMIKKKETHTKRHTTREGNWTDRLDQNGDNPFTGGAGFGGND